MTETRATCSTCRWFDRNFCIRFPPVPFREERRGQYDQYVIDVWAQAYVTSEMTCGEHTPKEQPHD